MLFKDNILNSIEESRCNEVDCDACIKHVCSIVGIPDDICQKIIEHDVHGVGDLSKIRSLLESDPFKKIPKEYRDKLLLAVKWADLHPNSDVITDFNQSELGEYILA